MCWIRPSEKTDIINTFQWFTAAAIKKNNLPLLRMAPVL